MSACDVDVLIYNDVFISRKSYVYKCVKKSVKQDPRWSSVFGLGSP